MAEPLRLEVPARLDGERVDKVIADLAGLSRAQARALLDIGVLLDGSPAKPGDRVREGSVVDAPEPQLVTNLVAEPVDFDVVHEDPDLIVVDKPPRLVVHPGAGTSRATLAAGLLHRYPELEGVGDPGRWGLVHRLDRDTSGVLLVGRNDEAFDQLRTDLARRRIGRVYLTLAQGRFATPTGTIDAPIGRDPVRPTRRAVVAGGKPAVTHYEVLEEYLDRDASLLQVRLETGRTHQIRVHLAAIDHPVVGDRTYSATNTPLEVPRVFLHSWTVALDHPRTRQPMSYTAPLPEDLRQVLDGLGSRIDL